MSFRLAMASGAMAIFFCQAAMAQGVTTQDKQWFVNLLNTHMGHEFCPPPGTTFGAAGGALSQYNSRHGISPNSQLTDADVLKALAEIYPCAQPKDLSADEAKKLGSKPLGSVSGHYTVHPTGIYATIDTSGSTTLLNDLHGPPSEKLDQEIRLIQQNSGDYLPPILLQMAIAEYNSGKVDSAIFWLHAGLMRTILDVKLCSDHSVADTPTLLIRKTPLELVKAAFSDDPKTTKIVQDVVAWDIKTPFHYDHRWIALHGAQATASALDPAHAPTSVTIPEEEWANAIAANRETYPKIVASNAANVKAAKN